MNGNSQSSDPIIMPYYDSRGFLRIFKIQIFKIQFGCIHINFIKNLN